MSTMFLNALKQMDNFTKTENGAVALSSTGHAVLDAFGSLAAMKDSPEEDILRTWQAAFSEDKELAMRLLFYVRDIRGGQGMRRVFRVIVKNMAYVQKDLIIKNLDNFLFFGRGDDVLCLLDTPIKQDVILWIGKVLVEDAKAEYPSLLAKWLPSENASSAQTKAYAREIIKGLNITPRAYRRVLSKLRKRIGIVETLMSQNRWEEIQFDKLPSRASMIYSDAFMRHVEENYINYLKKLAEGDAKVNAGALFPVDIIHKVAEKVGYSWRENNIKLQDIYLLTAMWKALPDYFGDTEETGLCVVDTSGSMSGTPLEVAVSLGMYCADKAKGPFHGNFITFSSKPKLQQIIGDTIVDKYRNLIRADWEMNTDLEAVFDLILNTAVANNMAPEDLPTKLYIISDMQFDDARGNGGSYWNRNYSYAPRTFMDRMKLRYARYSYTMPAIVYWNVRASKCGMFQQTFEGENCAMVSGYSPSLFKAVIEGTEWVEEEVVDTKTGEKKTIVKQKIDPIEVMKTTLMNERYDRVLIQHPVFFLYIDKNYKI